MTIWSLKQIHAVRGLWARVTIDDLTTLADHVKLMDWARHQLVHVLADLAHPFAVEIAGEDVEFDERPGPKITTIVSGRWHPQTHMVELLGGPAHSRSLAVANIWDPLRTATPRAESLLVDMTDLDTYRANLDQCGPMVTDYRLAGWREQERHWVFTPTGKL